MTDLSGYAGKLALVTGAGDGIGKMLAQGFARAGMRVAVADIRAEAAGAVAAEIGAGAFPLVFDISDRDACFAAAEELRGKGEVLNLLWANAGVGVGAPVLKAKQHVAEWGFAVNVLGTLWTAQAFVPLMETATGPRHLGFTASSLALWAPRGDFPLYATTKHGTFAVAEAVRGELAAMNIGATILCPGILNTDIWDAARARPGRFGGARRMDPAIAGEWRAAKSPEVMWPHIERTVAAGGGYLTCSTETWTREMFDKRHAEITSGIVEV